MNHEQREATNAEETAESTLTHANNDLYDRYIKIVNHNVSQLYFEIMSFARYESMLNMEEYHKIATKIANNLIDNNLDSEVNIYYSRVKDQLESPLPEASPQWMVRKQAARRERAEKFIRTLNKQVEKFRIMLTGAREKLPASKNVELEKFISGLPLVKELMDKPIVVGGKRKSKKHKKRKKTKRNKRNKRKKTKRR